MRPHPVQVRLQVCRGSSCSTMANLGLRLILCLMIWDAILAVSAKGNLMTDPSGCADEDVPLAERNGWKHSVEGRLPDSASRACAPLTHPPHVPRCQETEAQKETHRHWPPHLHTQQAGKGPERQQLQPAIDVLKQTSLYQFMRWATLHHKEKSEGSPISSWNPPRKAVPPPKKNR